MSTNVVTAPPMAAAGRIRSGAMRELNATFAIAWREISEGDHPGCAA